MSSLLYKWVLGKTVGKIDVGKEDPFFEEIPNEELKFYQRHGARRKRALPPGLSQNDQKILKSVRRRAYHLDLALSCCGFRFGWAGVIGLIPWIGDLIAGYFALLLLKKAQKIDGGLPAYIQTQMSANIAFDFGIGLIPIVGDIINMAYKANSRNCLLVEEYLRHRASKSMKHGGLANEVEPGKRDLKTGYDDNPNSVPTSKPGNPDSLGSFKNPAPRLPPRSEVVAAEHVV